MTHLGKPQPAPYVDEEDLLEIAADLGPGIFPSARIYGWYVLLVQQEDRQPVSKKKFGLVLKEAGWHPYVQYLDGVMTRCWMISKPWVRRGLAMLAEEKAADERAKKTDAEASTEEPGSQMPSGQLG